MASLVGAMSLVLGSRCKDASAQTIAPVRSPDVVYVPTAHDIVLAMLALAEINRQDVVYDLGCGDGRIVIAAAYRYGARGVGVDIDPQRVAEASAKARALHLDGRVNIVQGDLFGIDLKPASVVMLYLSDEFNQKLRPKLLEELKPGTRIVSHHFAMSDWKPERIVRAGGDTLFLWRVPATE